MRINSGREVQLWKQNLQDVFLLRKKNSLILKSNGQLLMCRTESKWIQRVVEASGKSQSCSQTWLKLEEFIFKIFQKDIQYQTLYRCKVELAFLYIKKTNFYGITSPVLIKAVNVLLLLLSNLPRRQRFCVLEQFPVFYVDFTIILII